MATMIEILGVSVNLAGKLGVAFFEKIKKVSAQCRNESILITLQRCKKLVLFFVWTSIDYVGVLQAYRT